MIEACGLSGKFGEFTAVDGISITIDQDDLSACEDITAPGKQL